MVPEDPGAEDNSFLEGATAHEEQIVLPIDGVLDLHTFSPKEVADLLEDYVAECLKLRIYDLRIIHGKGKGILKDQVRKILAQHPMVESFSEAPLEAGSWGATMVRLRPQD
jgi:DNA-nicking Smr family endonuclease